MAFSPAHRILGKLIIPYAVRPNEAGVQLAIMVTERSLFVKHNMELCSEIKQVWRS